jgi:hypothetical protein
VGLSGSAAENLVSANAILPTDPATAPSSANSRVRQPDTCFGRSSLGSAAIGLVGNLTATGDLRLQRPPLHSPNCRSPND